MKEDRSQTLLEVELAKAQLEALKLRMNPHFIANMLASIRSMLFRDRKEEAIDYLTQFSTLLRTTLENASKDYITLADELIYIRNYLDLEELRFAGKFKTRIVFTENLEPIFLLVPPNLFQPYIENAINHGLMHKSQGGDLLVRFSSEKNLLVGTIEDNGVGRQKAIELEKTSFQSHSHLTEQVSLDRIELLNKIHTSKDHSLKTIDLVDNDGNAIGTRVEIRLPIKHIHSPNEL